jgi:hypothetical protein
MRLQTPPAVIAACPAYLVSEAGPPDVPARAASITVNSAVSRSEAASSP